MKQDSNFTVQISSALLEALDDQLSPMDGIQAIEDIYGDLPLKHRSRLSSRLRQQGGKSLSLYRGRFGWIDIGFSYVQIGDQLHVVELWHDTQWAKPRRREVGCVLGQQTA